MGYTVLKTNLYWIPISLSKQITELTIGILKKFIRTSKQ